MSLALPLLEAMGATSPSAQPPMRLICIGVHLGFHGPAFFPKQAGAGYQATTLLAPINAHRQQFTVFSNLDHPGVGKGHPATVNFLTGTDNPKKRRQVSLDQVAARAVGQQTRFASLQLEANDNKQKGKNLSWAPGGVALPQISNPRTVFDRLFSKPDDNAKESLGDAKSVLDHVLEDARQLQRTLGQADSHKLEEYLAAIREVEQDIQKAERFAAREVDPAASSIELPDRPRLNVAQGTRVMLQMAALALQTDLTRVITLRLPGEQHQLSHHGQKQSKIRSLVEVQKKYMAELGRFLAQLQSTPDGNGTLLDHTVVLFGSGMGNASTHSTRDLPILVAGGGFRHGRHVRFGKQRPPLANLYVTLLRRIGVQVDKFSNSRGALTV